MTNEATPLQLQSSNQLAKPPVDYMAKLAAIVDHPAYNVAQMIPGVNIPANALAYASHMQQGEYDKAKWDSLGMVPGAGVLKGAKLLDSMKDWGNTVAALAKNYPGAMMRTAATLPNEGMDALRVMGRMTGRQVGNAMQVKNAIDASVPTAQAAYLSLPDANFQ